MSDEITKRDESFGAQTAEEDPAEVGLANKKKKWIRLSIGLLAGGLLGFAYYSFIGCNSGGCPITSSPYISTLYGSLFGAVIAYR